MRLFTKKFVSRRFKNLLLLNLIMKTTLAQRENSKKQYYANREKIRKRQRAYFKEWYQKNKERQKQTVLSYYQKNKRKWIPRNYHYRLRKKILDHFNSKCCLCGSTENLQIHHLDYTPKLNFNNLQLLCKKCHDKKHLLTP